MLRRVCQFVLLAFLLSLLWHLPEPPTGWGTTPASAQPTGQVPEVSAEGVVVWDDRADRALYTKNPHQRFAPASITKIMTAIVAIERGDLDEIVPIQIDAEELAVRTDSTTMRLYPGERLSLRNLLYGLMLPSGNDAAIEIARHIGGSEPAFVDLMNAKAEQLGMVNSRYLNPHGLDEDGHYTTAHDMTLLGRYAMQNPVFAEIVGTRARVFYGYDGRKLYQLGNLDRLVGRDGYEGIKIGFTEHALSTYVGSVQRNGRRLYVTLLRSQGWSWDAQRLVDHFYAQPAPPTATPGPSPSARGTSAVAPTATPAVAGSLSGGRLGSPARQSDARPSAAPRSGTVALHGAVGAEQPAVGAAGQAAAGEPPGQIGSAHRPGPGGLIGLLAGLPQTFWRAWQR